MTAPFKLSTEAEKLIDLLISAAAAGRDRIPYEELSTTAGVDVTDPCGRGYLTTARTRVQADKGDVWGTERTVGVYLMPHGERAEIYRRTTTGVRRKVRGARKIQNTIDVPSLTPSEMESLNTGRVVLSLIDKAASRAVTRRIETAVEQKDARVLSFDSVDACLDFLKRARGQKTPEVRPEADPKPTASPEV